MNEITSTTAIAIVIMLSIKLLNHLESASVSALVLLTDMREPDNLDLMPCHREVEF